MEPRSIVVRLGDILSCTWSCVRVIRTSPTDLEDEAEPIATRLNDSLWLLNSPPDGDYDTEVIFVHGLQLGDFEDAWRTTWTNKEGKCWPREFWKDKYPTARILSVTYDSSVDQTDRHGRMDSLYPIAEQLLPNLFLSEVGQKKNCPLMFVGHGLGCFVIESLMTTARTSHPLQRKERENFLANVGGFVFYSPFSKGVKWDLFELDISGSVRSPLADLPHLFHPALSRLNDSFGKLRSEYRETRKSTGKVSLWDVLVICESQPTARRQGAKRTKVYVEEASARDGCDQFLSVPADHFNVCKHNTTTESGYMMVCKWLDKIRGSIRSYTRSQLPLNLRASDSNPSWDILPEHHFTALFPDKSPFYTYESFIEAVERSGSDSEFGLIGDDTRRTREIAAFLAHIYHGSSGLRNREESTPSSEYCQPSTGFPYYPGKSYHARGPMRICWNYNYKQCGDAIHEDLVSAPEKVSEDPVTAFRSAIWFWCTTQWNKPSCHSVMTGLWEPTEEDIAANRHSGFGVTTNIINGGYECGKYSLDAELRLKKYKEFCELFGVEPGENLDTASQKPFG